jgi:hypothetical protein
MRPFVCSALLAGAVLAGTGGAYAQDVIEVYPSAPYYEEGIRPAPRAYVPVRPASCGEFRYWNGSRCVDARAAPPELR